MLLIGPAMVLALLWPQRLSREGPSRLAWLGLGLIALSTVGDLFLQAPYTTGGGYFERRRRCGTCSAARSAPRT